MRPNLLTLTLLALMAIPLITGCGRPGLVGKWQGSVPYGRTTLPITMEFKPDGTDTQTTSVQSPVGPMSIVATGTYAAKDATLQMTQTAVTINGRTGPANPRLGQAQSASFKVDGDTLTMTPPGGSQSLTLTRVKG